MLEVDGSASGCRGVESRNGQVLIVFERIARIAWTIVHQQVRFIDGELDGFVRRRFIIKGGRLVVPGLRSMAGVRTWRRPGRPVTIIDD